MKATHVKMLHIMRLGGQRREVKVPVHAQRHGLSGALEVGSCRRGQVWEVGRPLPEEEGGKAGWLKMPTKWKVQDRECQGARQTGLG